MKLKTVLEINLFICLINYTVESVVIGENWQINDTNYCVGKVVLSSSEHSYTIAIYSNNLRSRKRTKRKIKARKNGYLLPFEAVKFTGNCCWKVRDKFRGGQSFVMPGVGTYVP